MKLIAFELPDDPNARAQWLEEQLVGTELIDLVTQWSIAAGADQRELQEIVQDRLPLVLKRGLSALAEDQISALVANPNVLIELQTCVLLDGGDYWDRVAENVMSEKPAGAVGVESLESDTDLLAPSVSHTTQPATELPKKGVKGWLTTVALAASILLLIFINPFQPKPTVPGWGFAQAQNFADAPGQARYFEALADAANAWFNKRPTKSAELETRLNEFVVGCDMLIDMEHKPLDSDQSTWLKERCGIWRKKLAAQLVELGEGADAMTVRNEADEIVNLMVKLLRERAAEVSV